MKHPKITYEVHYVNKKGNGKTYHCITLDAATRTFNECVRQGGTYVTLDSVCDRVEIFEYRERLRTHHKGARTGK